VNMRLAMLIAAGLCVYIGCWPWTLYGLLPFDASYNPFEMTHVITQMQLLMFGGLAVFWMMRNGSYPAEVRAINLEADWLYRRLLPRSVREVLTLYRPVRTALRTGLQDQGNKLISLLSRSHGPGGTLARTWPIGSMALWVAVLLAMMVLVYYV